MSTASNGSRERHALVIATSIYEDSRFSRLRTPARDAIEMADVLRDPAIGRFNVKIVQDATEGRVRRETDRFVAERRRDDVALIYLSCHGMLDRWGKLYFAAADTDKDILTSTGIAATWLQDALRNCRASQQILILDCCYSGAYGHTKDDGDVHIEALLGGRGRVVLTASGSTEYSYEGERRPGADTSLSVFTSALVGGLRSGAADRRGRGRISVDDAYQYAFDQLRRTDSAQIPQIKMEEGQGEIFLAWTAQRTRPDLADIPANVIADISSSDDDVRFQAVMALSPWLNSDDAGKRRAAQQLLREATRRQSPVADAPPPASPAAESGDAPLAKRPERTAADLAGMNASRAGHLLDGMSPVEVATVLAQMEPRRAMSRVAAMEPERAAQVLTTMPLDGAAAVLTLYGMSPRRTATILEKMSPERVSAVLNLVGRASASRLAEVMEAMPPAQARETAGVMNLAVVADVTSHLVGPVKPSVADVPETSEHIVAPTPMPADVPEPQWADEDDETDERRSEIVRQLVAGARERAAANQAESRSEPSTISTRFEARVAGLVNLPVDQFFRGEIQPMELLDALQREADTGKVYLTGGRTLAPNRFVIQLSAVDNARFASIADGLAQELAQSLAEFIGDQAWTVHGDVVVVIDRGDDLHRGLFRVASETNTHDEEPETPPQGFPAVSRPPGARLVGVDGRSWPLSFGSTVIGRSGSAGVNLFLDDAAMLPRHARLDYDGWQAVLTDLGSANGTFVNGQRITVITLNSGDLVHIGSNLLRYVTD